MKKDGRIGLGLMKDGRIGYRLRKDGIIWCGLRKDGVWMKKKWVEDRGRVEGWDYDKTEWC